MATIDVDDLLSRLPLAYACHKMIFDSNGKAEDCVFLDANFAFEEMTGLAVSDIIGKKATEILPDIRSGAFDWIDCCGTIVTQKTIRTFTQYQEHLQRWYKITAYAIEDDVFVTIFQDVTVEEERMCRLKHQHDEISVSFSVFNNVQLPLALLTVNDGEIRYLRNNTAHQALTGLSVEDIQGKTPVDVFGVEKGSELQKRYEVAAAKGNRGLRFEEVVALSDGLSYWENRVTPIYESGVLSYLLDSRMDITDMKTLQAEKDNLLEMFQAMFTGHSAVMTIIDPETQEIIDANPAACHFFGFARDKAIGMKISSDISPNQLRETHQKVLKGEISHHITGYHLRTGEVRRMEVYSSPIFYGGKDCIYSILFDVTDREEYWEALQYERDFLSITLSSIGDGVIITDRNGCITFLNQIAEQIIGWKSEEVHGKQFSEVFVLKNEETEEPVENPITKVLNTGVQVGLADHTVIITKRGEAISVADNAAPIKSKSGDIFGVIMVFRDVSLEKAREKEVLFLSHHDALTGLYNRRFADQELIRLDAEKEWPLSIIVGDVNGLKLTNDIFGHDSGDGLLKRIAEGMRSSCRQNDIIARWGGDEFLILLPQTPLQDAQMLVARIKETLEKRSDGILNLSLSLGCAAKTKECDDIQQIVNLAEDRMYQDKLAEAVAYRKTMVDTMISLQKDNDGHAERVRTYSLMMGKQIGLPEHDLEKLGLFAELHDIGKVAISSAILQKSTTLTEDEWDQIRLHPIIGYRIAMNEPSLMSVAEYILSHHERWDGTGYPQGLCGAGIPLYSRLLAVAGAYDTMTNDQPYCKALSRPAALEELQQNAGTQFDAGMVQLLIDSLPEES